MGEEAHAEIESVESIGEVCAVLKRETGVCFGLLLSRLVLVEPLVGELHFAELEGYDEVGVVRLVDAYV